MNGRALNEKAIEVSPSSSRVLDRAQEILQPFPPSKNRPRPGDWNCPSCGFSNFQRRTACFRCSYPAMGPGPAGDQMGGYGYGYGGPPHGMIGHPHMGQGHGMSHIRGGHSGGMVPFRAGDWKCGSDGCGYHNFAKNISCLRCGAGRAGAAVVADSAFPSSMDTPSSHGMYAQSMAGTPGPGPYGAAPSGYGSSGGYHGQQYGGPPSTYALPSGLGAASPYAQMSTHYGPGAGAQYTPGSSTQYHPGSAAHSAGFDSRAAEHAFSSAGQQTPSSSVGQSMANGGYGYGEGQPDPFSFLSTGLGSLSMSDDGGRRNGATAAGKSPT